MDSPRRSCPVARVSAQADVSAWWLEGSILADLVMPLTSHAPWVGLEKGDESRRDLISARMS